MEKRTTQAFVKGLYMNLPYEFELRMKELLGDGYSAFYEVLCNEDEVKGLRVNRQKVSAEKFSAHAPFALRAIPYASDGFIVDKDAFAGKHPYHHAGVYYMQDPGAMATVSALPAELWERKNLRILDVCAAPGGKTTQLAALCSAHGGVVLANEYNGARSRVLAGNVERMGLSNVCVTNVDSKYLAQWYPDFFDVVVVDAPCSGEGMYRKTELAISEWSLENVRACAVRQAEILDNAVKTLASGGYLLYSTCTYSTEENEETVSALMERNPYLKLCAVSPAVAAHTANGLDVHGGHDELALCRRFYPHVSPGEGQFVALLQNTKEVSDPRTVRDAAPPLTKADRAVAEEFLRSTLGEVPLGLQLCGGNVTLFPAKETTGFPLPPFGVIAAGAALGEIRKGRLIPHHHFFMAYGDRFLNRRIFAPEDAMVSRYLAGEELELGEAENGFCAVCLALGEHSVSLGGGKISGGRLKNYYPKGLRVR